MKTPQQVGWTVNGLDNVIWAAYGPEIQRALRDELMPEQRSLPLDPQEPF